MKSTEEEFKDFADRVRDLCVHISVREDEDGVYIFAIGLKNKHTLQLRKVKTNYIVELWHGETAETETAIDEPSYSDIDNALNKAKQWLERDAI